MTNTHRADAHTTARRPRTAAARRPSAELVAEGVVATYIHELSRRHGAPRRLGERLSSSPHQMNAVQAPWPG